MIKLTYGTTSFLLTGDAEMPSNKAILDHGFDVRSTVLKLGHHGSRTSTNEDWLTTVQPQLGIISAGKDNSFGHPHPEVIAALEKSEDSVHPHRRAWHDHRDQRWLDDPRDE